MLARYSEILMLPIIWRELEPAGVDYRARHFTSQSKCKVSKILCICIISSKDSCHQQYIICGALLGISFASERSMVHTSIADLLQK